MPARKEACLGMWLPDGEKDKRTLAAPQLKLRAAEMFDPSFCVFCWPLRHSVLDLVRLVRCHDVAYASNTWCTVSRNDTAVAAINVAAAMAMAMDDSVKT